MKTKHIYLYLIISLLLIGCSTLTKEEKEAQKMMMAIAEETNELLSLPNQINETTYGEKVRFDKESNSIIYTYIIDKSNYHSEEVFNNVFNKIKNDQLIKVVENQGKNENYEILKVTIKSIYKNAQNDTLFKYDIKPNEYLETELIIADKIKKEKYDKLFGENAFHVELNKGLYHYFSERFNHERTEFETFTEHSIMTSTLNLITDVGNPFDEYIERTDISVDLILEFKAGKMKFTSKPDREYLSLKDKLSYFDISDFIEKDSCSLEELQKYEYHFKTNTDYVMSTNNTPEVRRKIRKERMLEHYSKNDLKKLEKSIEEFEKYFDNNKQYNYFTDFSANRYYPEIINKKEIFCLRLFQDFERSDDDIYIERMPTLNIFGAEKVEVIINLIALNSNGFHFSDKVKTIDITDKWNKHFVMKD